MRPTSGGFESYATWLALVMAMALTACDVTDTGPDPVLEGALAPLATTFGVTSTATRYTVSTGAGLVFQVDRANCNVPSIRYRDIEYNDAAKASHIGSGLGAANVSSTVVGNAYVKIACSTSTLTHYLIVRNGVNNIYMATWVTAEPPVGELRWITRLRSGLVSHGPPESDIRDNTGAIESADMFGMRDGTTRSKYYGRERAIDLGVKGATGDGVGFFMHFGNRESSSGGPFYRDIENQCGADQEIYNYMNSGHAQTEPWRMGVLHGPYALIVTDGAIPSAALDYSWIENAGLDLTGYVGTAGRGFVRGKASIPGAVVGFANSTAQYWTRANGTSGRFSGPGMKPGVYTQTLYQGELEVARKTVTVNLGANTSNITSAWSSPETLWKIGEWDGTPLELLNGSRLVTMHPSDVRMHSWGPVTFRVGQTPVDEFPSVQLRAANTPTTILFELAPDQVAAHTLRIGITTAQAGGRPVIQLNDWGSAVPPASQQPSSRGLTTGTYRGLNALYTFDIPARAFRSGSNTLQIGVASGSGDAGPWLSPAFVYDCVELDR